MSHTCHWPGCETEVPPKMWGCKMHWFMLPKRLRDMIWATYRPGQEITKTPSRAYIEAANLVQDWIAINHPPAGEDEPCPECGERPYDGDFCDDCGYPHFHEESKE